MEAIEVRSNTQESQAFKAIAAVVSVVMSGVLFWVGSTLVSVDRRTAVIETQLNDVRATHKEQLLDLQYRMRTVEMTRPQQQDKVLSNGRN